MRSKSGFVAGLVFALLVTACSKPEMVDPSAQLDPLAERYVKLALALGEHDDDYVDAYFGPAEWREQAAVEAQSLDNIITGATSLAVEVRAVRVSADDFLLQLRQNFLASHLDSLAAVASMRNGTALSFDEESRRIYGFVAPTFPVEHYDAVLAEIDVLVPGDGPLHERLYNFDLQFRISPESNEAVIRAGMAECRARTLQRMDLPEGEAFVLEMVTGNPWGAYNWFQGGAQGLIQVETSRPLSVFSATSLGCHEGYPGHHTYSSLLEQNYLLDRGWIEFSLFPLFSPQGIIFEGSGDYAEKVAFPGANRTAFMRDVILPIAGIDEAELELRAEISAAKHKIRYAGIEAARNYLDGVWDREQTTDWLINYALTSPDNIDSWFGFTDRYRAYRINYILGQDLVETFVRSENPDGDNGGDWQALAKLLSYPPAPMLMNAE